MPNITKPLELLQLLLMENTSQDEFLDFQKRFQSFIDQSPSFLHSVGKKGFFPSFFFGAFATLLDSRLANFDGVQVKEIYFRFNKYGDLKLAVLTEDSKTQNEKLICIAVSDNEDQEHKLKFSKEELANIASQIFPDLAQSQESQSRHTKCKIVEYNVTINKEKKVACNLVENFKDFNKLIALTSTRAKEFTPIRSQGVNLESLIGKLADKSHAQVMNTMKEVLDYITDVYSKYKNDRGIKKRFEGRESSYHGFLAGFLMNFKYRYHLKLYLELFAGKGQADIILLVRGTDKSSSAIPIIIELKAKTDAANTPQKAVRQVQDYVKGFFSNFVRMVTAANEVVCVGLNFEMNHVAKYSFYAQKLLDRRGNSVIEKSLSIPQIMESTTKIVNNQLELRSLLSTRTEKVNKDTIEEKLEKLGEEEIDEIIKNRLIGLFGQNENKVDKQRLKELLENLPNICTAEIIRKQLEYLYYGIVWSNGGSDNIHYVSQFILGQLMLVHNITDKKKSVAKYVFICDQDLPKRPSRNNPSVSVVDKYDLGCVRTTVLIIGNEVFILNITEIPKKNEESLKAILGNTAEYKVEIMEDNKIIPIENIKGIKEISNAKIHEINCHLHGTPNNKNPFDQYCDQTTGVEIKTYNSLGEYKKDRALLKGNFESVVKKKEFKKALKKAIESGEYDDYKKVFKEISCILYPFKSLINNEATFQAVLHSLFSSCSDDHIKVITECQIGGGGKIDMMLIIKATDGVKEYPPVGIELKFAKEKELNKKVKEAEDQLERYQKGEAYKVVTDANQVKLMYAIFDQGAKDGNSLISIKNKSSEKFKEVDFVEVVAKHSSDIMLPGQQPTGNVQQPAAQRAGHSRVVSRN